MLKLRILYVLCLILTFASCKRRDEIICYGNPNSDLTQVLKKEG